MRQALECMSEEAVERGHSSRRSSPLSLGGATVGSSRSEGALGFGGSRSRRGSLGGGGGDGGSGNVRVGRHSSEMAVRMASLLSINGSPDGASPIQHPDDEYYASRTCCVLPSTAHWTPQILPLRLQGRK
jgi:hypothetical protein